MRILFDQNAPVPIAAYLREHTVRTALQEGWDRHANGELLRVAEAAGFDVLLTTDNSLEYQQNLKGRKIAIVVITRNRWRLVQRVIRKIVAAVNAAEPGTYVLIEVPIKIDSLLFSATLLKSTPLSSDYPRKRETPQ